MDLTEAELAALGKLFEANTDPGATERLMAYWTKGKGAAKIRWGEPDDFSRCVSHLGKYVADPKGLCSNLHVRALGVRPGKESAVPPTQINLVERAPITGTPDAKTGKGTIQIITPGWGSSGYYSADVLAEAAKKRVFPKGTKMYVDHPTQTEATERPERSVKDIAAVLTEDARLDDKGGLVSDMEVLPQYRESLSALAAHDVIGCSIRASGLSEAGEAEGRTGMIVTELAEGHSVDFVTAAGRGGKILALESDRVVLFDADEAMANDTQQLLNDAIQTSYGRGAGEGYAYVCDYDPEQGLVYFEARQGGTQATWRQSYSIDGRAVSLTGDRVQVRRVTNYVPVQPAGQSESQTPEEIPMGQIQIEESEVTRLREAAGRVQDLESARDTEKARADQAEKDLAESRARDKARPIVAKVLAESATLPASTKTRVTEAVVGAAPITDKGELDEKALEEAAKRARKAAEDEAAELLEAAGTGRITGFGSTAHGQVITEADKDKRVASLFGHSEQKAG